MFWLAAGALVHEQWPAIERIAQQLQARGLLNGDEVLAAWSGDASE